MPHKLNPTFAEFIFALVRPTTFNITKNKHIVFGLLLGLPIPALMLWLDFYISGTAFTFTNLALKFVEHPFHYFFIFTPFLTGIIFGAFGTIRRENNERIATLIGKLETMSNTDALTGLYNRRYFEIELDKEYQRASRSASPFAVVCIDLDNLKELNDTDGHITGDRVLRSIGEITRKNCRLYDVPARHGGDEYTVLLPNTTGAHAVSFARRLCEHIAAYGFAQEGVSGNIPITVSIGVATYPDNGKDIGAIMEAADGALYEAKRRGRNCIVAGRAKQSSAGEKSLGEDDCHLSKQAEG